MINHTPLKSRLIAALFWLIVLIAPVIGGGWTQPAGEHYLKLWMRWQAADGFLAGHRDAESSLRPIGNYNEVFLNAYGEYGLTPGITLVAHWPMLTSFWMSDINDYSYVGVGDPSAGLRLGLIQQKVVAALQVTGTAPVAKSSIRQPFRDTDTGEQIGFLRVGAGVWDLETRLQTGMGLTRGHIGAEAGYRWRSKGYHPVFSWSGEGGYAFSQRFYGTIRFVGVRPVGSSSAPLDDSPSGIGNGTKYTGFSMEIDWKRSDHLSVGFVLEGGFTYSRQTGGPVLNVYLAWR